MNHRNRVPNHGGSGGRIAETNMTMMEKQNDAKAEALAEQVKRLKDLSLDINDEVEAQNRLLDQMVTLNVISSDN